MQELFVNRANVDETWRFSNYVKEMGSFMPNIIVLATAAFVAGIWCAGFFEPWLMVLLLVAATLFGAAMWQIRCGSRYVAAIVLGLFFVVGIIRSIHADTVSSWDISRYSGQTVTLCGVLDEAPQWWDLDEKSVKVRYTIAATSVNSGGAQPEPVEGLVVISVRQPHDMPLAVYRDRIVVTGEIQALHGYQNPGRVDSVASLRLRGITARMAVNNGSFAFERTNSRTWLGMLAEWRQGIAATISQAMAPGDAAILNGILFGGYFGIKREVVQGFATTGLVHILSVSGTHIALVAGAVMWLGGRLGFRRGRVAVLAAGCIVFYALFAGLNPPVIRSVVMALIALAAIRLGREKDSPQALALTALIMLSYQPGILYDISFQLSFAATAGLVLFYRKTVEKLSQLPKWIGTAAAVTLVAQLGALPFMAWYFNSFPLSSFLANIIVLPLIEAVVVIGLFASCAGLVLPLLGKVLLVLCALLISTAVHLTALIAALPGASIYIPAVGVGAGAVYYLALAWFYGYMPRGVPTGADILGRWPYKTAAVLAMVIIAVFSYSYYPRPVGVHFIDVGQGDAALITTPHGRAVLIDSGGSGELSDFDVGERVVVPYLKHYGITTVDYLILTHGHKDHAGGAAGVARLLTVRNLVLEREDLALPVAALLRAAPGKGVIPAQTGQTITLDGVTFTVVHAFSESQDKARNEASNVVRVSYGNHSFLITGDLGAQGEYSMLEHGLVPGDVLKVAHHGAKTSSTPEFLQAFAPRYAVISAGYNNRYGHPHPETLQRLAEHNIKVYRTDRDGAVVFKTDGKTLTVKTFAK